MKHRIADLGSVISGFSGYRDGKSVTTLKQLTYNKWLSVMGAVLMGVLSVVQLYFAIHVWECGDNCIAVWSTFVVAVLNPFVLSASAYGCHVMIKQSRKEEKDTIDAPPGHLKDLSVLEVPRHEITSTPTLTHIAMQKKQQKKRGVSDVVVYHKTTAEHELRHQNNRGGTSKYWLKSSDQKPLVEREASSVCSKNTAVNEKNHEVEPKASSSVKPPSSSAKTATTPSSKEAPQRLTSEKEPSTRGEGVGGVDTADKRSPGTERDSSQKESSRTKRKSSDRESDRRRSEKRPTSGGRRESSERGSGRNGSSENTSSRSRRPPSNKDSSSTRKHSSSGDQPARRRRESSEKPPTSRNRRESSDGGGSSHRRKRSSDKEAPASPPHRRKASDHLNRFDADEIKYIDMGD